MDGLTDGRTDGRTDGQTLIWICEDVSKKKKKMKSRKVSKTQSIVRRSSDVHCSVFLFPSKLVFTVTKVASLIAIVIGGFVMLASGFNQNLNRGFKGSTASPTSFALALYQVFLVTKGSSFSSLFLDQPLTDHVIYPSISFYFHGLRATYKFLNNNL